MNNIDFAAEFLYINFDNILMQNNSPFLHSEPLYLQYKEAYLTETNKNYAAFKNLVSKLDEYSIPSSSSPTKITFTFTDNQRIEDTLHQIKCLVLSQRNSYNNFIDHVTKLSSTTVPNGEQTRRKTLLEKMGITSTTRKRR